MTIDVELLLALLIFYQVKHFIADFILQNVWMLQKSKPGWDFLFPLTIHAGVHAGITLVVALYLAPAYWWLAALDFAIHFTMDRIKAGPRYLGRFSDVRTKAYWVCFGFDQMVHHLTHIYICWVLALAVGLG
jgi:hypothetical protein